MPYTDSLQTLMAMISHLQRRCAHIYIIPGGIERLLRSTLQRLQHVCMKIYLLPISNKNEVLRPSHSRLDSPSLNSISPMFS